MTYLALKDTTGQRLSVLPSATPKGLLAQYGDRAEPKRPGEVVIASSSPSLPTIKNIHGWLPERVQALQRQTAQAVSLKVEFFDELEGGSQGPMMVVIPAGRFLMGSPKEELKRQDNERQHEVEIAPFAIGKYAVTFEEYNYFAGTMGQKKPDDNGWGRGRRPVIYVTWFDAVAYAEWLSEQTGQTYRLPTEAEWEYACRAGTTTPFYFGTTIHTDQANYDGRVRDGAVKKLLKWFTNTRSVSGLYRAQTWKVGLFPANAWGLHDMHGNVWEWTSSVYDPEYGGSEQRGAELSVEDHRVLRGGSWRDEPCRVRGAARAWNYPRYGGWFGEGFRLARTFP